MHTTNFVMWSPVLADKQLRGREGERGREGGQVRLRREEVRSLFHSTLQKLNTLGSAAEERQVEEVLARLKVEVSRRRLLLYPYFRDFDRMRYQHSTWQ